MDIERGAGAPLLLLAVDVGVCLGDLFELLLVELFECGFRSRHCAFDAGALEVQGLFDDGFDFGVHCGNPCAASLPLLTVRRSLMSVKKIVVRDGMSYDTDSYDPGVDCSVDMYTGEELGSMTKQSFKDECDINNIMSRYEATGVVQHVSGRTAEFGDFISPLDFQASMNAVIEAQDMFAQLPARVRDRFGNDPGQMLEFLSEEKNRDEAIALGLVNPPPAEPAPQKVEVVNPAPAASSSTPQQKGGAAAV